MDFFIKAEETMPYLELELIQDCTSECQDCFPEYKLIYKWRTKDTVQKGR